MLEQLLIFTRGGLVLWTYHELGRALKGSPIDALIRSCLLEERAGDAAFQYDAAGGGASYTLKWTFHNELGLVFVAVYQRMLHLLYVDDLLALVKHHFAAHHYRPDRTAYSDFDETFRQLLAEAEARASLVKRSGGGGRLPLKGSDGAGKKAAPYGGRQAEQRRGGKGAKAKKKKGKGGEGSDGEEDDGRARRGGGNRSSNEKAGAEVRANGRANGVADNGIADGSGGSSGGDDDGGRKGGGEAAFDVTELKRRMKASKKGGGGGAAAGAAADAKVPPKEEDVKKTKGKQARVWGDAPVAPSKMDFSKHSEGAGGEEVVVPAMVDPGKSLMDAEEEDEDEEDGSATSEDEDEVAGNGAAAPAKAGWFSSFVASVAGKASLEKSDLGPALKTLKERLQTKNVAEDIAEKLCESVAASLVGKKLGSFTRVSTAVKAAMEEALVRILTPKRSVDILRDVEAAREQNRPYVITFVGVNGVGKSTNLAKVAYWLQQHDVSVMMAACDTFRSGAVEQLRVHARRLQVPIFERGYEKDPAVVAKDAIREALRTKQDVVLVDTAGRMQDNEPLMRALTKLIHVNEPDLVLFVGEALVGNDAVDQLTKFNQSLVDLSSKAMPRVIDGILLTKFDTIDEKVGAALSMVYASGAPVVFVGCGQTYVDLKRLNTKSIIKSLLS